MMRVIAPPESALSIGAGSTVSFGAAVNGEGAGLPSIGLGG